jgi:hypothetical protein
MIRAIGGGAGRGLSVRAATLVVFGRRSRAAPGVGFAGWDIGVRKPPPPQPPAGLVTSAS